MDKIFINQHGILKKTNYSDIYFITRDKSKTYIILKDTKIEAFVTLNYLSEVLEGKFLRTHKSFIINIDKIFTIEKKNANIYIAKFLDFDEVALITRNNMKIISERYVMV